MPSPGGDAERAGRVRAPGRAVTEQMALAPLPGERQFEFRGQCYVEKLKNDIGS